MLNIYDLNKAQVILHLMRNGIFAKIQNDAITLKPSKIDEAQTLIDKMYFKMPDLPPTQFYFLLAKSGLDVAINTLLPPLKDVDLNKYAMYKAYLSGARYYEFSKALAMYTDIKDKILLVDDTLDFTEQQLKDMWTEAQMV